MNKFLNKKALEIKLDNRSKYLRKLIVQALIGGGRGHMGSAMSLVEILRVLYDKFIKFDPKNLKKKNRDRLILSKGHGCLALYSILVDKKFFSKELLNNTSKSGSILGGHPEYSKVPGVEVSTGALGHGMPIAVGMALAAKIKKEKHKIRSPRSLPLDDRAPMPKGPGAASVVAPAEEEPSPSSGSAV